MGQFPCLSPAVPVTQASSTPVRKLPAGIQEHTQCCEEGVEVLDVYTCTPCPPMSFEFLWNSNIYFQTLIL